MPDMTAMQGRVIAISGATGAAGKAAARAFAEQGASLVLFGTDPARLDELAKELMLPADRVLLQQVDLRQGAAVHQAAQALRAKFGRLDVLIHLVGGWTGGKTISETPASDMEWMLGQHVWTTFHLFQALGPLLAANGWGRVVVVSASNTPNPAGKAAAYTSAKAAQENLVLNLAAELKDKKVTANIIHVRSIDVKGDGKGASPQEIAATILYLCSDEAARINGAHIPLSG